MRDLSEPKFSPHFLFIFKKKSLYLQLKSLNLQRNIQNMIYRFTMFNTGKNNAPGSVFDLLACNVETSSTSVNSTNIVRGGGKLL
jgi:hypothetical protein